MTCTNLPPPALNARLEVNGANADYYCLEGFEMTSGTPRATCVGANTWNPSTPPVCTVIDNTYQNNVPLWVPIVCASLLGVILLTCLILAIVYCCCGAGRCCGGNNRTTPMSEDTLDDGYYDDREHYESKNYHGNGYYNYNGYSYRRNYDGPYVVPIDHRNQQKNQNREYVQYVMTEPQPKSKQKQTPQKVRTGPSEEVLNLVKLTNGQLVPLDKYLQDHPGAQLASVGDKDVVYVQDQGQKTDPKGPPRQAWRANNKRTPPRPVVRSRDSTIAQPVIVTVMNDLNDDQTLQEKDKTQTTKRKAPPHQQPQQHPHPQPAPVVVAVPASLSPVRSQDEGTSKPSTKKDKDKRGKDAKSPDNKVDEETSHHSQGQGDTKVKDEDMNSPSSLEPIRAQYVRSGSDLDTSLGDSDVFLTTPPLSTKPDFKRQAFTVRDYNRFRPAKDYPAWRPHAKPVRNNNTSTQ